ncbi:hypothetical protein [Xanthomonas cucurbitae]|uniref:DUF4755 domain-containing protein n=1 Tax=Xanthomonas cucurbitae TaxID=56453 RepID=A0ABY7YGI0_9XANT|nr:hypothetical protein [Xanthomonas cucurbitae]WDM68989.1 DUF4755 domain-containing protein [Xanthomonas cucurbitae]WDM72861.1 DUF4755 domain-containing protein [Xanthomonas cucurbitae]
MTVGTFLLIVLLGGGAVIVFAVSKALKSQSDSAAFKKDYQKAHGYKNTAIAVSTENSLIKLKAGKATKIYSFTDVRTWEKHWHNYNREGTLTIDVKDIDHPVWTIKFGNQTEMNKWYEVVRQAINEKLKL